MRNQHESSDQRLERIARIRRQIAAGTYETPEKLACAVDAFLERQQAGRGPGQPEEK
jgi:anti-sigma28 factor (negative regulator of flagellin synthesis)